jgi:hypothetical protein
MTISQAEQLVNERHEALIDEVMSALRSFLAQAISN